MQSKSEGCISMPIEVVLARRLRKGPRDLQGRQLLRVGAVTVVDERSHNCIDPYRSVGGEVVGGIVVTGGRREESIRAVLGVLYTVTEIRWRRGGLGRG